MKRREFLKKMGIGGAAAGASILAGKALAKIPASLDKPEAAPTAGEKAPFKRHVAVGWDMNTRAWCGRCGYVHIPGPFTLCCANPLLNVGLPATTCVVLGKPGAEMIQESIAVENWGDQNWDFDVEWRHRAHKIGLSVSETKLYGKGRSWTW